MRPRILAEIAAGACLAVSVAAFGGAAPWVLLPLVVLAFLSAGFSALDAQGRNQRLFVPLLGVALAVASAVCLFQLVPLPGPLLGLLSPPAQELRNFALLPLGLHRLRPVSLDAPSTARELAKHLAYLALFLSAVHLGGQRGGARRLLMGVGICGAAVALVGLTHLLLDVHVLFGLFPFTHASPPLMTPFGNPNHLAGMLTLSSTLLLGLALTAGSRQRAAGWALLYVVSGAGVLLSLSRGGIAFFGLGQVTMVGLAVWLRRRPTRTGRAPGSPLLNRPLMAVGLLAAMASVGAYVGYEGVMSEMQTADSLEKIQHSKVELWPMMAEAAFHVWPLGMGRGAFQVGFPRFQTHYPEVTFTHPENVVLQLLSEMGLLVAALLLSMAAAAVAQAARKLDSLLDAAILVGLSTLFLHELFDFSWELPATAVATVLAAGALFHRGKGDVLLGMKLPRKAIVPAVLGCGAVALLCVAYGRERPQDAEDALQAKVDAHGSPREIRALALEKIDAHPADALLYSTVGWREAASGSPSDALAFLNRALFLRPLDAASHRATALALRRLGHDGQALGEYRLAVESGAPEDEVWREALPLAKDAEALQRLLGDRPMAAVELAALLVQQKRGPDADGLLVWAEGQVEAGKGGKLFWQQAQVRLANQDPGAALGLLDEAEKRGAPATQLALARSEALRQLHRTEEAFRVLEAACAKEPENVDLGFRLVEQYLEAQKPVRAREALSRLGPYVRDRVRYFQLEGGSFQGEGKLNRALESYESAVHLAPERADLHYSVANVYEGLHRNRDAMAAVEAGMRLDTVEGAKMARDWLGRLQVAERQREQQQLEQGP